MTTKDIKIKSITGDSVTVEPTKVDRTSTYMKLAGLALGSYFLAKKDPYVLDGLSKELKRQEEAADVTENEFVKGAASSVGEVLAKNKLDREKRVNENLTTIEVLSGYGMDSALAAKATELNMGKELQALRTKFPNINLNKVFKEIDGTNLVGYSKKDLAKILVGQPAKLDMDYKALGAPPRNTFLSGVFGGDTSKFAQDKIKRIVESQNLTPKDEIDYAGSKAILQQIEKGEYGKKILALAGVKEETISQKRRSIADDLQGYMGVKVGIGNDGGYIFQSGSDENQTLFKDVATALEAKINEIYNTNKMSETPDPALTTTKIRENLIDQFTETVVKDVPFKDTDGKDKIRKDVVVQLKRDKDNKEYVVNSVLGKQVLPKEWNPTTGGSSNINKKTTIILSKADKIKQINKDAATEIALIQNSQLNPQTKKVRIKAIKKKRDEDIANVK